MDRRTYDPLERIVRTLDAMADGTSGGRLLVASPGSERTLVASGGGVGPSALPAGITSVVYRTDYMVPLGDGDVEDPGFLFAPDGEPLTVFVDSNGDPV